MDTVNLNQEEIFKKNEHAIYNLLTLFEYMIQRQNIDNLVGALIMEHVINDFEDDSIYISYKGKNIFEILNYSDDDSLKNIEKSYKADIVKTTYGDFFALTSCNINIIHMLATESIDWAKELLVSNANLDKRLEVLYDLLKLYDNIDINRLFESSEDLRRTPKEVFNKRMRDLLIKFMSGNQKYNLKAFFNEFANKNIQVQNDIRHAIFMGIIRLENSIEANELSKKMKNNS